MLSDQLSGKKRELIFFDLRLHMSNLEKYNEIFMRVFDTTAEKLNETFTFKDVPQWDSVAHLTLISELEDSFDIMFDSDDILHYGSYLHGIELIKRYGINIEI